MLKALRTPRGELTLFLVLTFLLSSPFYALLLAGKAESWTPRHSHLFMWMPGLAALIITAVLYRGIRRLGLRPGPIRNYLVCYAVPFAFCAPVYLFTWLFKFGGLDLSVIESRLGLKGALAGAAAGLLMPFAASMGILLTVGEELGWSGILTPRLLEITTFARASIIRGVIWSLWHYPLIIFLLPRYRPGLPVWYALLCMTVTITAISFVYTWLRIASGSVWPAALLHAVSSAFQDYFEAVTTNTGITHWITYETGLGFALILPVIAWLFYRYRRKGTAYPPKMAVQAVLESTKRV